MAAAKTTRGGLALVLHSHMPYVEGFGTWPFGEEWLFEAAATVYLPLVELLEHSAAEGHSDILTIGLTPVLCDQLELDSVRQRLCGFLQEVRPHTFDQDSTGLRASGMDGVADSLELMRPVYEHALEVFSGDGGDLLARFRQLASDGTVGLWTSAATHPVLPLLTSAALVKLQIEAGICSHRQRFESWSGGFWLPECAYFDGLEKQLAASNVKAFCLDQSCFGNRLDSLEPIETASGVIAATIDWPTIELVWSQSGYPAHPEYRDYHAQTVHGLRPYNNGGLAYDDKRAHAQAELDAEDFLTRVANLLDGYRSERDGWGLVTCALDTELLGHWWYEGQQWLKAVIARADDFEIELVTLPAGLERVNPVKRSIEPSTWGSNKDLSTWDCRKTSNFVWSARQAEESFLKALGQGRALGSIDWQRGLRELMAIQASDWAFMAERELAADYPVKRVEDHLTTFKAVLDGSESIPSNYSGEDFNLAAGLDQFVLQSTQ